MARDNGQGMFTMAFINEVAGIRDLEKAKARTLEVVEASAATPENKEKGRRMVAQSPSLKHLVLGLGNFTLSHMGMKTIR